MPEFLTTVRMTIVFWDDPDVSENTAADGGDNRLESRYTPATFGDVAFHGPGNLQINLLLSGMFAETFCSAFVTVVCGLFCAKLACLSQSYTPGVAKAI